MKAAKTSMGSRAIALMAAVALVASSFMGGGLPSLAGMPGAEPVAVAYADEAAGEGGEDAEGPREALVIVAGAAKAGATSGSVTDYTFPNLTVTSNTDKLIQSITVQFTTQIASGDDVVLGAADGFTLYAGNKRGNRSVNAPQGATAEQWQEYLRKNLTVKLDGSGMKGLRMIASFEKVDRTLDYNSLNGHYYEYVHVPGASDTAQTVSWSEALHAAEQRSYMGMTGYLVTVTSADEKNFITSLVNSRTWLGGCSWPEYTGVSDSHPLSAGAGKAVKYYWVCGPEKGTLFAAGNSGSVAAVNGQYANFRSGEPNNASGVGQISLNGAWADRGEAFVHMYDGDGGWNDYPEKPKGGSYYVQGYIIEYGDNPLDEPDGDTNVDVDVDVDVDVYVKVDINVDPTGKTITTEADDWTVGGSPTVKENVNGDPHFATANGVQHTYFVKDPGGPAADGEGWRPVLPEELNAEGVPFHVGDYKVVSTADRPRDDGTTEAYTPGVASFTIKPKPLDVPGLMDDSRGDAPLDEEGGVVPDGFGEGDGSGGIGGDGALGAYGKVYDGTAAFDASRLSLTGFALAGADVAVRFDEGASYDSAEAGARRTVTLENVRLEGADAADYSLRGLKDGRLAMPAVIYPRGLTVAARSSVVWGLAGQPLQDASGAPAALASDEDVHDDASAAWARNMLAPVDARRTAGGGLDSILGEAEVTCTRDSDGLPLDPDSPQAGLYTVRVSFANVNPSGSAPAALASSAAPLALGDALGVRDLGGGRYDIGNYLLTLESGKVLVSDNPEADDLTQVGEVVADETIEQEAQPGTLGPGGVTDLFEDRYGDKLPDGVRPNVTITQDGKPVDRIDLSTPGEYVIVATYPDPDGGPDKIVRVVYEVKEKAPENEGGNGNGDGDGLGGNGGINGNGTGGGSNGGSGGANPSGSGDSKYFIDETVKIPLDADKGVWKKDDIAKDLEDRYGDRDGFPKGVKPEITIRRDGVLVGSIDLSVPGTYVVEAVYKLPDGTMKTVRTTYVVGSGENRLTRLAQTGDPAAPGATLALAACALAAAAVARRRTAEQA